MAVLFAEDADYIRLVEVEVLCDIVERYVIGKSRVNIILDALGGTYCGALHFAVLGGSGNKHLAYNFGALGHYFIRVIDVYGAEQTANFFEVYKSLRLVDDYCAVGEAVCIDNAVKQLSPNVYPYLAVRVFTVGVVEM